MSDSDHWTDCWMQHFPCALIELKRLRVENAQLRSGILEPDWMVAVRKGGMVDSQSGPIQTHTVTLQLHAPGPTWSHRTDEPPTR